MPTVVSDKDITIQGGTSHLTADESGVIMAIAAEDPNYMKQPKTIEVNTKVVTSTYERTMSSEWIPAPEESERTRKKRLRAENHNTDSELTEFTHSKIKKSETSADTIESSVFSADI